MKTRKFITIHLEEKQRLCVKFINIYEIHCTKTLLLINITTARKLLSKKTFEKRIKEFQQIPFNQNSILTKKKPS